MKLKITNRTIGWEVLFFFGSIILLISVYAYTQLNNTYCKHHISGLQEQIAELNYNTELYESLKSKFVNVPAEVSGRHITQPGEKVQFDDIPTIYQNPVLYYVPFNVFQKKLKDTKYRDTIQIVANVVVNEVKSNKSASLNIGDAWADKSSEMSIYSDRLYKDYQVDDLLIAWAEIILIGVYAIRYGFFAIRWAIRQIKSKDGDAVLQNENTQLNAN